MEAQGLTVWTVGHSNKSQADFIALLAAHGIALLIDVRRFPGSRRYPWFNREILGPALQEAGIGYQHFPELGGRRMPRPGSLNTAWRNDAFRGYADYMETAEFREAIERLIGDAKKRRTAVMCAEALWWQCHRSMIADYLKAEGCNVLHIMSPSRTEEHRFRTPARIISGSLTYHAAQEQPELFLQG